MSIETTCDKCGEEFDMRHGLCPVCYRPVAVEIRSASFPFNTWQEDGYLPFELHGERFAVTRVTGSRSITTACPWRVTHVDTGAAAPGIDGATIEEARDKAIKRIGSIPPDKLQKSLAAVRKTIAEGKLTV